MCGVTGGYDYIGCKPFDRPLLARMVASIAHRGPDDEGTYLDDRCGLALGVRRLSIIDLAGGHQPITNEDETLWLVFNGEIYNFPELRKELLSHGHTFRTRSDTETVLHAWEQWGMEGLARLNGMFGLALWDTRTRTLVLARDSFGVKPLYYHDSGSALSFGSELRTILCDPGFRPSVDLEALDEYISFSYVPSPRTAFQGIRKLPPGHALVCTPRGANVHRFSRPPLPPSRLTEAETTERLTGLVRDAVKRQMISDVPIGVMLSGGVDSSAVAAIMAETAGGPIDTFTVGFEGEFEKNELEYARQAARRLGSRHHEVTVSSRTYADFLHVSIRHLEEPVATGSTLAFYEVCRLAREHVKVVLTGQGADEPFAGYLRHVGERYGAFYRKLPLPLRAGIVKPLLGLLPRNEPLKRAIRSLDVADPVERLLSIYNIIDEPLKRGIYRDGLLSASRPGIEAIGRWHADTAGMDALNRMLYVDARTSLPDNLLLYGDKMSMAVSLEARVPMLDLELMAFAESIPARLKIRGLTQKYALKKAVARWVPRETLTRKKIGFATPIDTWLQNGMATELRDRADAAGSLCRTLFKPNAISALVDAHVKKAENHHRVLFALLTLEIWHDSFMGSSAAGGETPSLAAARVLGRSA
jgi:asparagine synthase (glutamine-hydrolysing)